VDMVVLDMHRFQDALHDLLAELGIGWSKLLEPIPAMSPGLSHASGFEHLLVPPDSLSCSARHRARFCATRFATAFSVVYVAA